MMKNTLPVLLIVVLYFVCCASVLAGDETEITGGFTPIGIGDTQTETTVMGSTPNSEPITPASSGEITAPDTTSSPDQITLIPTEETIGMDDDNELELMDDSTTGSRPASLSVQQPASPQPFVSSDSSPEPTATIFPAEMPLVDVPIGTSYMEAVQWAFENQITAGVDGTHFDPDEPCTRAQFVTFLWSMAGEPKASVSNPFQDVKSDAWYYEAVLWAAERGIAKGVSERDFDPDGVVSCAQVVTFLYRYYGEPKMENTSTFRDVETGSFYSDAVSWAALFGITKDASDTRLALKQPCNRAQALTFLHRASTLLSEPSSKSTNRSVEAQNQKSSITKTAEPEKSCHSGRNTLLIVGVLLLCCVGTMMKFL